LKTKLAGVPPALLETHGAVSKPVAQAMAEGIRSRSGANIGIGITGVAGPSGGTPEKPVGLVYISLADERGTQVRELRFPVGRQQAAIRAALAQAPSRDREINWTRPEGIHLTLKFLGETDRVDQVIEALQGIGPFEKFFVEVKGFGFFPDARRPRVLWTGIEAPPALAELAGRVETAMEKLGFPPEQRPFTPHLTLARFQSRRPETRLMKLPYV